MFGVAVRPPDFRSACPKFAALFAVVTGLACVSADVRAQSAEAEQAESALQVLLPLAGAFCDYQAIEADGYSSRLSSQAGSDDFVISPDRRTLADNGAELGDVTFLAAREAAVSGAERLNESCISGLSVRDFGGGSPTFDSGRYPVYDEDELGLLPVGSLVGFRNENLKFKLSARSLKLRFELDF